MILKPQNAFFFKYIKMHLPITSLVFIDCLSDVDPLWASACIDASANIFCRYFVDVGLTF